MSADLARLRAQVRAIELRGRPHGALSLGDAALDDMVGARAMAWGALHEVFPRAFFDQHAAGAFVLAALSRVQDQRPGACVWVRTPGGFDGGRLYGPGMAAFGFDSTRLLLVTAPSPKDALWVTEEALKCAGVAGVALELGGTLELASSRRLQLAAEAGGGLGLVLRAVRAPGASVARTRWRVGAAPSAVPAWSAGLAGLKPPGAPRWRVALTRSAQDSEMLVEWRHATRGFHLVAGLADDASASGRSERAA